MKTGVVTIGWHIVDSTHRVEMPRSQYEQRISCAGLKALFLGLPILAYGCRLKMYQRKASFYALVFHQLFTARDSRGDNDGCSLHDGCLSLASLMGEVGSFLVWMTGDGMLTVAHHLHLTRPPQQEQVAECAVATTAYLHMQASAHEVRQESPQHGAAGVVMHISNHSLPMALIKAHRVIVIVIEERALPASHKGVVFLTLLL